MISYTFLVLFHLKIVHKTLDFIKMMSNFFKEIIEMFKINHNDHKSHKINSYYILILIVPDDLTTTFNFVGH